MADVVADIEEQVQANCDGKLHGVVATHRHKDHISGFGGATGAMTGSDVARSRCNWLKRLAALLSK